MQLPLSAYLFGTVVPVSALKTEQSCGTGEFLDLIPFAEWCKKSGLTLVQILPVNDTGTDPSPYNTLSAYALHPLYIRIAALPEAQDFTTEITELTQSLKKNKRVEYTEVLEKKQRLLQKMYRKHAPLIVQRYNEKDSLWEWVHNNQWIIEYAVFKRIKRENVEQSWKTWEYMRSPVHSEIMQLWENEQFFSDHLFYAWLQMHLHLQLLQASRACLSYGVHLKGDIPIMMNEDSVDVWAHSEFFREDLRAGSPPDADNPDGQNWGFPIYHWENMAADNYRWWKNRLTQAAQYYQAYRLDHIIGFFRIWAIPEHEYGGSLGRTVPTVPIPFTTLQKAGFSVDRIRWMTEPHVTTRSIEEVNNGDYLSTHGYLHLLMDRIGDEELWLFKKTISAEADISHPDIPERIITALRKKWKDRMLIVIGKDSQGRSLCACTSRYKNTTAWQSLSETERKTFQLLLEKNETAEARLWEKQASVLLEEICTSVTMTACAEDLGAVPEIVPKLLQRLGIYRLKVIRWERRWEKDNQPFIPFTHYDELSVVTPSVHDSSSLRGWWDEMPEQDREEFLKLFTDKISGSYTPHTAAVILTEAARTPSRLCIVPIQDLLTLDAEIIKNSSPADERINLPGTVSPENWSYRLPLSIEQLITRTMLCTKIKEIADERPSHE